MIRNDYSVKSTRRKGGFGMSAVLGAFVQYSLTVIYFVAIAAAGIFAGKKLHKRKMEKQSQNESAEK